MFWTFFGFFADLPTFDFEYRELLQRKCFFSKIGSLYLFQLWRNFPIFWQAFEIFKFWHPVARWGKKISLRFFFPKNVIRLWVKLNPAPGLKTTRVRVLKLHSIGPVELIKNNFFFKKTYRFATFFGLRSSAFRTFGKFFWQSCRSFILVVDRNSTRKT